MAMLKDPKFWLIILVVIVVLPFIAGIAITIYSATSLPDIKDSRTPDLSIKVTANEYSWNYKYLKIGSLESSQNLAQPPLSIDTSEKNELVIPSGKIVELKVTSGDLVHRWWVPEFGSPKDAIPDYVTKSWLRVDEGKEGRYQGRCTEHEEANPFYVTVVPEDEFFEWFAQSLNSMNN